MIGLLRKYILFAFFFLFSKNDGVLDEGGRVRTPKSHGLSRADVRDLAKKREREEKRLQKRRRQKAKRVF